jgi:hypothetical protein
MFYVLLYGEDEGDLKAADMTVLTGRGLSESSILEGLDSSV